MISGGGRVIILMISGGGRVIIVIHVLMSTVQVCILVHFDQFTSAAEQIRSKTHNYFSAAGEAAGKITQNAFKFH